MNKQDLFQACRLIQYPKINQGNLPHQQANKNHMIISIDTEKVFDKIHHSFFIKLAN